MSSLKYLFKPIKIGGLEIKNRIVMPAMSINFGVDDDGFVTDQLTEYFAARAKGGTGLLLVGGGAIDPLGKELPSLPALWDDASIPHLKKMTKRVKSFDTAFGIQIMHGGRQTYGDNKVAPSPIEAPALVKGIPKELNIGEINDIVNAFGDSAARCREGGFDLVEVHAAHGYLINQFMSPNANKRVDEYGGSYENRIRFLLEIIRNIKSKTGADFPLGIRLNGEDYIADGWKLADAIKLAPILEQEGVAYLHVSAGVYGSTQLTIPSMYVNHGCFVHLAEAVKKIVSIPVIAVGRIKDPELADRIIGEGKADMIAMARAHLADPELANKGYKGNLRSIRPCIGCCFGCFQSVMNLQEASCVVNPSVGREYLLSDVKKTSLPKKVLVLGAGPAGLAAARTSALQGHKTIILEKKGYIGGMARTAAKAPGRSEIMDVINFFANELSELNVELRLNVSVDQKIIEDIKPDEAIIATGSLEDIPIIKGVSKTNMLLCTASDVMNKNVAAGWNIVILGGNRAALTLADYLGERGRTVTVFHNGKHFAEDMAANDRFYLRERLKKNKVALYKKIKVKEILHDGLVFHYDKDEHIIRFVDTLIISDAMLSIRNANELFKNRGINVKIIGDANSPRDIMFAISEAEEIQEYR